MKNKITHCISIDPKLLADGPPDLAEQLRNDDRVQLKDMSSEAYAVLQKCWDPAVDGSRWPPFGGLVIVGVLEKT